ncbi:MAG: hypothetical protein JWO67_1064 [Streptosporangiaceae bacterium]|nr:hypothetical protein [Streptosporangiaceae bacterium]
MTPDTRPSSVPQAAIPADPATPDPQDTPDPAQALSERLNRIRCPHCKQPSTDIAWPFNWSLDA